MSQNQIFLAPPADARAALFFLEGHYQLNWREGSVEKMKYLSPAQIGRVFSKKEEFDSGWFDSFTLRAARGGRQHKILSFLPAGKRKIFVTDPRPPESRDEVGAAADDPVLELVVPLPGLLLLGAGQKYYLWATLDRAVSEKSKICAAPFPNLNSSGEICFGRNNAPECRLDTIESVWRMILDSPFNGHQAANRCRTHPADARELLINLDGKKNFPKTALVKTNHTVGELWRAGG